MKQFYFCPLPTEMVSMTTPSVCLTESKPQAIGALRSTWRRSAEHFAEQLQRFVRLTLMAALPSLISVLASDEFDTKMLLALIVPFAEVAYRQMFPAMGAAGADRAPGVTIVPEQVGLGEAPAEGPLD